MAATFTEKTTQIANAVKIIDDLRTAGGTLVTNLDTHDQALEGDYAAEAGVQAKGLRSAVADAVLRGKSVIDQHLFDVATAIGSDATDPEVILSDLYKYMEDNNYVVKSRSMSYGSVSAGGSNVGTGTIYRLTSDQYGNKIESCHPTTTTVKCLQDQNSGTLVGREVFTIYQSNPALDILGLAGSGQRGELIAHAGNEILQNASFQTLTGSAASPTDIPGWTSSVTVSSTNYTFDETNYFRKSPEEAASGATPRALNVKATATLSQTMRTLGVSLSPSVPYVFGCRWNRQVGSASGTLTLHLGDQTTAVSVAAQTGWQTLIVAMDLNVWLRQFNEDDLDVKLAWSRSGGDLLLDDVFFGPMTQYDGLWYFALGGATHFLRDDIFTFTDSENA